MKKFALTLVFAVVCLVSAAQQSHMTLLEKMKQGLSIEQITKPMQNRLTYTQRFDSLVSVYDGEKQVMSYTYDENANLATITQAVYEGDIMEYGDKYVYAYDENNYCILDIEYDWTNGIWREIDKKEYTNDANGNRLSEFYYSYEEPIWKYLWTYDSDNHCLLEERWYYHSEAYHPSFRTENTYDSNGNLTLCLRQEGNNETWNNYNKTEYAYDIHNNLISEVFYQWYSYDQDWWEKERTTYSYDVNNNLICKMVYGDVTTDKTEYTYNEANNLILSVNTRFGSGNYWENRFKSEYEYDQNDSLVMEMHCVGDYYNYENWHNNNKVEYVRNDAGYVTCQTDSRTSSVYDDSLYYENRYLYDYDNQNRMISAKYLRWRDDANDFVYSDKEEREFDENGNILKFSYYDYDDDVWVMEESFENTYDLTVDAAHILGLSRVYNEIFTEILPVEEYPVRNKWLSCRYNIEGEEEILFSLYYSDYYAVNENESPSLKVYSKDGTLTVENDVAADIQVFDMLGRIVAQQSRVAQCQFHLKPGVYVVKADNASVKAVVK